METNGDRRELKFEILISQLVNKHFSTLDDNINFINEIQTSFNKEIGAHIDTCEQLLHRHIGIMKKKLTGLIRHVSDVVYEREKMCDMYQQIKTLLINKIQADMILLQSYEIKILNDVINDSSMYKNPVDNQFMVDSCPVVVCHLNDNGVFLKNDIKINALMENEFIQENPSEIYSIQQ